MVGVTVSRLDDEQQRYCGEIIVQPIRLHLRVYLTPIIILMIPKNYHVDSHFPSCGHYYHRL